MALDYFFPSQNGRPPPVRQNSSESEASMNKRLVAAGSTDHLGWLPDELLQYVLSFLPSRDAVRTCVLARRNLWKDVPAVRITTGTVARYRDASALNKFVNYLLFFRNRLPRHVAEFNSLQGGDEFEDFDEAVHQYMELWVRYSLSCPVVKLCIFSHYFDEDICWVLPKGLITSEHLTMLEFTWVESEDDLDFSSCVSLEDLKMDNCSIYCNMIISPSLKRLSIMNSRFIEDQRTQISVPNLIFLLLADFLGRTPLYCLGACHCLWRHLSDLKTYVLILVKIVMRLVVVGMSYVGDAVIAIMERIHACFFKVCQAAQNWS